MTVYTLGMPPLPHFHEQHTPSFEAVLKEMQDAVNSQATGDELRPVIRRWRMVLEQGTTPEAAQLHKAKTTP